MAVTSAMKTASVLLIISILINSPKSEAMDCNLVTSALSPCYTYLMYGGPVSYQCCASINNLNNAARTTPDRQTACSCLKQLSGNAPPATIGRAAAIPQLCRINIPYKIDPRTDCSRVR